MAGTTSARDATDRSSSIDSTAALSTTVIATLSPLFATTTTLLLSTSPLTPENDTSSKSSKVRISTGFTVAIVIITLIACVVLATAFLLWRKHTKRRGGATLEAVAVAAAAAATASPPISAAASGSQENVCASSASVRAKVHGHSHLVVNQVYSTSPPYATVASSKYEFVAASTADRNNTYDKWGAARSTPVYAHSAYYNVAAANATAGRVVGCGATAENARAPLPSHADYSGYEVSAQQNPPRIIYAIPLEDNDEANIVYAIPVEVETEVVADDDAATQRGAAAAVRMPRMSAPTEPLHVTSAGHGRVPNPMYVPADASSNRLPNQWQRKSTAFAAPAPAPPAPPALKSSTRGQKQRIVRPTVGHKIISFK